MGNLLKNYNIPVKTKELSSFLSFYKYNRHKETDVN